MEILFNIFVVALMLTTTVALITAVIFLSILIKSLLADE